MILLLVVEAHSKAAALRWAVQTFTTGTADWSRIGRGLVEEESGRLARTFAHAVKFHFPRLHHRLVASTQSRQMLLNITPRVTVSTSKHI
jgi:hypothetical protein